MYSWYTPRAAKQLCFLHEIDGEEQGEKNFDFSPHEFCVFEKKVYSDFVSSNATNVIENKFLEKIGYV